MVSMEPTSLSEPSSPCVEADLRISDSAEDIPGSPEIFCQIPPTPKDFYETPLTPTNFETAPSFGVAQSSVVDGSLGDFQAAVAPMHMYVPMQIVQTGWAYDPSRQMWFPVVASPPCGAPSFYIGAVSLPMYCDPAHLVPTSTPAVTTEMQSGSQIKERTSSEISTSTEISTYSYPDGIFHVQWWPDALKLKGSKERRAISPLFEVPRDTGQPSMYFRFVIKPAGLPDDTRKLTFDKAGGKGTIQLKCESDLRDVDARVYFYLCVGDEKLRRGPFHHDFVSRSVYDLPAEMADWDFGSAATCGGRVLVGLEVLVEPDTASESWGPLASNSQRAAEVGPGLQTLEHGRSSTLASSDCAGGSSRGRKRSEAGRQKQLLRWQRRFAAHVQTLNRRAEQHESEPIFVCSRSSENSPSEPREARLRPTYRAVLCGVPPLSDDPLVG